jgi:hypothetical protein
MQAAIESFNDAESSRRRCHSLYATTQSVERALEVAELALRRSCFHEALDYLKKASVLLGHLSKQKSCSSTFIQLQSRSDDLTAALTTKFLSQVSLQIA